jgi:hypothetical protein
MQIPLPPAAVHQLVQALAVTRTRRRYRVGTRIGIADRDSTNRCPFLRTSGRWDAGGNVDDLLQPAANWLLLLHGARLARHQWSGSQPPRPGPSGRLQLAADSVAQVQHPVALDHYVRVLEQMLGIDRPEVPLA